MLNIKNKVCTYYQELLNWLEKRRKKRLSNGVLLSVKLNKQKEVKNMMTVKKKQYTQSQELLKWLEKSGKKMSRNTVNLLRAKKKKDWNKGRLKKEREHH